MKRGVIEIQFNWLFTLIAGGLILLFFFGIVNWAKDTSQENLATTISLYLDTLFTSSSVAERSVTQVPDLGYNQLSVACDTYDIDGVSRPLRSLVLSPARLAKGDVVIWSESWDVPMLAERLLMISTPEVRYLLFGESGDDLFDLIVSRFPEELGGEINPRFIENEGHDQVRAIFVNVPTDNSFLSDFVGKIPDDVTAVRISDESGSVRASYYRKSGAGASNVQWDFSDETDLIGEGMILGSTIAQNAASLDCQIDKARERLTRVALIHKMRADDLATYYSSVGDFACQNLMQEGSDRLSVLATQTATVYPALIELNRRAQRSSCAYLY